MLASEHWLQQSEAGPRHGLKANWAFSPVGLIESAAGCSLTCLPNMAVSYLDQEQSTRHLSYVSTSQVCRVSTRQLYALLIRHRVVSLAHQIPNLDMLRIISNFSLHSLDTNIRTQKYEEKLLENRNTSLRIAFVNFQLKTVQTLILGLSIT